MSLPIIEDVSDPRNPNHIDEEYTMDQLTHVEEMVRDHLEGDCRAVVMNGEVLFNSYRTDQTSRETILDFMVRSEISNDPHRHLFVPLMRSQGECLIEIYMFPVSHHPWKLCIHFDAEWEKFVVKTCI